MKKIKYLIVSFVILILLSINVFSADIIGAWSGKGVSGNLLYNQITIEKDTGSYKMTRICKDGSVGIVYLKKSGEKFLDPNGEDYYVISSSGNLKICDSQGVFLVLPKDN